MNLFSHFRQRSILDIKIKLKSKTIVMRLFWLGFYKFHYVSNYFMKSWIRFYFLRLHQTIGQYKTKIRLILVLICDVIRNARD